MWFWCLRFDVCVCGCLSACLVCCVCSFFAFLLLWLVGSVFAVFGLVVVDCFVLLSVLCFCLGILVWVFLFGFEVVSTRVWGGLCGIRGCGF